MAASACLTLREIENELRDVTEWYQLGVQLELTLDTLRTIESNYRHDAKRCKIEVLGWWLRNAPETSWEKLAQALEAMGGHASLTEELRKKISPIANENETTETSQNGESVIARNGGNGHGGIYSKVQAEPPLAEHLQSMDIDEDDLIVQTHDIRCKFLVLITQVRRCLENKGVTVREFVGFLKQVPGYARKSLFDLQFSNLYEAPDLIAVFESVGEYCSWFNHSLLSLIIEAYCEDNKPIKKAHQEYCLHLQKYCKYRVRKFPFKNGFGQGGKRDKMVIMKVDRKWEEIRIEQLEEVVFDVACILKVSRHALHLCSVDKGCVQLTVVVPSCILEEVFPLTPEQEAGVRKIGVIDLNCGSYHFSCQVPPMDPDLPSPNSSLHNCPQYSPKSSSTSPPPSSPPPLPSQQIMSYTLPSPTYKDWLRAWREWARTRKRGKMAQFVVDKLEDNKQARWLDITIGKFELTQWHTIAEEWFKEKPRNSDQVDAPCMLRKGLPRAFPGLEEVKAKSIKEGTQYRSRVFQATPQLVQEVMIFTSKKPNYPTAVPQTLHGSHELLAMKPFPNQSPLEGGGTLTLVFSGALPPGNKWVSFTSTQRNEYTVVSEAYEENPMALTTIIPKSCSLVTFGCDDEQEMEKPAFNEKNKNILEEKLDKGTDPEEGGAIVLNRLVQIAKMEKHAKQEEEREQQVPSTPEADARQSSMFTDRPLLIPKINIQDYDAPFADDHRHRSLEEQANPDLGVCMSYDTFTDGPRPQRTSSANKLKRREESISDKEYDAITPTSTSSSSSSGDGHGRRSLEEQADSVAPLIGRGKFSQSSSTTRRMLVATHFDADSAVSMSFDRDECESEILHSSCSIMSTTEGAVDVNIDRDAGETFVNSVQYECTYIITEDYPPGDKEVVFKAGDRIVQVGNTYVRDKGPEDFAELLHREATKGTTIKIIPRVELTPPPSTSPPPSAFLTVIPSMHGRKKHLEGKTQQLIDSMTMKISNLLTMKASGTKRTVTIPRTEGGYGFKMIGGNAVGLFISEVRPSLKDVTPGDQILQVNGQDTSHMTHFEATDLLRSSERVTLVVTENNARFKTLREQFEFDSFFIRSCLDHTSTDPRDMKLHQGTLMRVVNTILYGGNFWLAWTVDESTGLDSELRRIPSPAKIKKIHGKDAYERVATPRLEEDSARVLVAQN